MVRATRASELLIYYRAALNIPDRTRKEAMASEAEYFQDLSLIVQLFGSSTVLIF